MPQIGTISTYESGVDLVVEWKIEHFFTLPEDRDGEMYWSPEFSFGGEKWWLRILPDGSGRSDSGHVDLDLCKRGSSNLVFFKGSSRRSIKQTFSLSLKTRRGEKYNEKHGTKDFDDYDSLHRFNRFIPRWELTLRKSKLVPEGDLTIVCTMKSSTSAVSDREEVPTAEVNKSDVAGSSKPEASGSSQAATTTTMESEEEVPTAEVNKSDVAGSSKSEASGSSQAATTTTKKSVLKWIKENCKEASKGKKRKTERENVLEWIERNFNETSEGKKRKMEEKNCEACASDSSASPHEMKLAQDLKEFFLQKEDCDVIIKVKGSEIPAHRVILKARSPIFTSAFQHNMKESATSVVEIEDCEPAPFSDFLHFLYCGDVGMISQENYFSLFTLADKYEVLDLKAKCLQFMKRNLTIDTLCEIVSLALQHSETELIALATDFFVKNAEEILHTDKWQAFVVENPTQSIELCIKFVKSVKHSTT